MRPAWWVARSAALTRVISPSPLVALAIAAVLYIPGAAPVFAASQISNGPCSDPDTVGRWSGQAVNGQKHGTAGTIRAIDLKMCTNPEPIWEKSGTFAFVNVEGAVGSDWDIVQIGIGKCRYPFWAACTWNMEVFFAWGRNGNSAGCSGYSTKYPSVERVPSYDGLDHNYKVFHNANFWYTYVDADEVRGTPESSICWTPARATWFGESHDSGDAIGGRDNNRETLYGANYANAENGGFFWTSWNTLNACSLGAGAPNPNGQPYFCKITSATSIAIWTDR